MFIPNIHSWLVLSLCLIDASFWGIEEPCFPAAASWRCSVLLRFKGPWNISFSQHLWWRASKYSIWSFEKFVTFKKKVESTKHAKKNPIKCLTYALFLETESLKSLLFRPKLLMSRNRCFLTMSLLVNMKWPYYQIVHRVHCKYIQCPPSLYVSTVEIYVVNV